MSTIKLYYKDAYIKECDTEVISCTKTNEGNYDIITKATCFFPEAGGQSGDIGYIDGTRVCDTQIDKNDIIHHICESSFNPGATVHLKIDFKRRHTFMQHHSGEHIFSGIVKKLFGYDNVGFHLSDNICTMDYNGSLTDEDVADSEKRANEIIYQNAAIDCTFPSDSELEALDYRCKGELKPPIRIVSIDNGNVDCCACCAPHVSKTGEIGTLHVSEAKSYKGGVRLTIICGRKLLSLLNSYDKILNNASHQLSVPYEEINTRISLLNEEKQALKQEIVLLHQKELEAMLKSVPDNDRDVILFTGGLETKTIRNAVNSLTEKHNGICGIFCGNDTDGYSFIIGSASVNLKETAETLRNAANAKCGGSERMIQGSIRSDARSIKALLQ